MTEKLTVDIDLNDLFKKVAASTIDSIITVKPSQIRFDTPEEAALYYRNLMNLALDEISLDLKGNLEAHLSKEIVLQLVDQSKYFNRDDF